MRRFGGGRRAIGTFLHEVERFIARWHDIAPPNLAGARQAGQLDETVAAHARLRGPPALEGGIGDFAHMLRAHADRFAPGATGARRDALARVGLAGLRGDLRARRVRAVDALAASLARIDRLDGRLNAVLWQERAAALAEAQAADRRIAAGAALALDGVPLAHKDIVGQAGRPQTAGSALWREHRAAATATVLARLNAAGAISFAGLNMGEFAQNPTGHNAAFGNCINPWGEAAIAGGSSSGSAVAVAAGYCTAALGTDTGGSIRLPASCCGVTGLKPTYGLISRAGVVPLCASLDCVGPIGRTALDCAILLDAIAGVDPADPSCVDRPARVEAALNGDVRGMRIGVPSAWFFDAATMAVRAAIDAALAVLRDRGARLVPAAVPWLEAVVTLGGTMARAEAAATYAGFMRDAPERLAAHVAARLYPGYAIPATLYIDAVQQRPRLLAACAATFAEVDVIATPTLRDRVPGSAETDVDSLVPGTERAFFAVGGNVRPFNYLGLPAVSVPCGFDAAGMPIGLQLVGRPFGEARLLCLADAYQRDAGPPPLAPL